MQRYCLYISRSVLFIALVLCVSERSDADDNSRSADSVRTTGYILSYALEDEVVVTGTRYRQPVWRTPVAVSVISADDLSMPGVSTIADILEHNGSMTARRYGSGSGLATASIRGMSSDQTLVLLNGVRLNSPQNGLVDLSTVPLQGVGRIEINRGGASSLYGSSAIGGVIHIITEMPDDSRSFARFGGSIGSFGYESISMYGGIRSTGFEFAVGAGRERSREDFMFNSRFTIDGSAVRRLNADFHKNYLNVEGRYRAAPHHSIGVHTRVWDSDRGSPGPYVGGSQSRARQSDSNLQTFVSYSGLFRNRWHLQIAPSLLYTDMVYSDPDIVIGGRGLRDRSNTAQAGFNIDFSGTLTTASMMNIGTEYTYTSINADNLLHDAVRSDYVLYLSTHIDVLEFAGVPRVSIYPSVRYDRMETGAASVKRTYDRTTWRIGLNVRPMSYDKFIIRSSAGSNFKAPNFNDMYWVPGGNPDLSPESSFSFDAGIRFSMDLLNGNFTFDGSGFLIETADRIVWLPGIISTIWSPVNFDRVYSKGIELEASWTAGTGVFGISMIYVLQEVRIRADAADRREGHLPYIPGETLKADIRWKLNPFMLHFQPRYSSHRHVPGDDGRTLPSYFTADLNCKFTLGVFTTNLDLGIHLKNIFDTRYELVKNYPLPGRHFLLSLQISYPES